MLGALSLFMYNQYEAEKAAQASAEVMPVIVQRIQHNQREQERIAQEDPSSVTVTIPNTPVELLTPEEKEMTEFEIDGVAYIGYIVIPALDLELPVVSEWSYSKLYIAPCRHQGTVRGEDLVIAGHNYPKHFGNLSDLELNDEVYFVDMNGVTTEYRVVAKDILEDTAVEEMLNGLYDLTLYTCTYGRESRVTIRCDIVK